MSPPGRSLRFLHFFASGSLEVESFDPLQVSEELLEGSRRKTLMFTRLWTEFGGVEAEIIEVARSAWTCAGSWMLQRTPHSAHEWRKMKASLVFRCFGKILEGWRLKAFIFLRFWKDA